MVSSSDFADDVISSQYMVNLYGTEAEGDEFVSFRETWQESGPDVVAHQRYVFAHGVFFFLFLFLGLLLR